MELVSVIVPTYKGSKYLTRAIESIIGQTYPNIEIIVVDDNNPSSPERQKTENTVQRYLTSCNFIYEKHERNKNGAAARNTGIRRAKGEYVTFLDDDDYYLPERIEKCVDYLHRNKEKGGLYTGVDVVDDKDNIRFIIRPKEDLSVKLLLEQEMVIGTGSNIFLRREIVDQVKGFDEEFIRRQDIEFMIRVCHIAPVGYIPDKLIIKASNGVQNHPKYENMKDVIKRFSDKFKSDIKNLGAEKNNYYATQARALFNIALFEQDKKEIREAVNMLKRYDKLTFKEHVLYFLYISGLRYNTVVVKAISFKDRLFSDIKSSS